MNAMLSDMVPASNPKAPSAASPATPRKRKRRQRSGGAGEDCFACRTRAAKCDRKRPYCTQCIEIGKECSGYRTQLTWGVGVASRGKLRGLSLPIAGSDVAEGSEITRSRTIDQSESQRRTGPTIVSKTEDNLTSTSLRDTYDKASNQAAASAEASLSALADNGSGVPQFAAHANVTTPDDPRHGHLAHIGLQRLDSQEHTFESMHSPDAQAEIDPFQPQYLYSPVEFPYTSNSLPFYNDSTSVTSSLQSEHPLSESSISVDDVVGNNPGLDSLLMPWNTAMSYGHDHLQGAADVTALDHTVDRQNQQTGAIEDLYTIYEDGTIPDDQDGNVEAHDSMSLIDTRFGNPFHHLPPRFQTWMNYYEIHICPYLVAFDGVDNPYRKHILHLALNNEGLQNAIAALSTNNLRMRQKDLRQYGIQGLPADLFTGLPPEDLDRPTVEELCYKQTSIDNLNMQLTNKRAAQDDSVLATLLILCLFHVCDSGFSKFKTQLAGVQKLLAFREPETQSGFTRWVEMFFTWFDVMTSAVNDRETQIRGDSMALMDFSSNLGAMEQFSGCDGKLFKLIARLGRLNLLAQGRPVRSTDGSNTPRNKPQRSQRSTSNTLKHASIRSLSSADYANIDGNGWGTPIVSSDDEDGGGLNEEKDDRTDFWSEWHEVRNRLMAFQMDLPNIPSATSPDIPIDPIRLEAGQRDMLHINESFRCSALLYTERLGNPVRPSSHHSFQRLVADGLYHITSLPIDSCVNKFLLWPLFIIGTECIDESHRDIIRRRCIEVQKESGFFNNISTLEVLERVWMEAGSIIYSGDAEEVRARRRDSEASRSGRFGQAFRWRKAMDRVDGEYIVI